jgi:PAX-interacting protein 1
MGLDPTRFLVDPDDEIGQQQVQQKQQEAEQEKERARDLALQNEQMAVETSRANIGLIKAEVDNKKIDNKRQLLSAEDESNRKWAEVQVKAMGTEGAKIPPKISVDFQSLYQDTEQQEQEQAQMQQQQQQQVQQLVQMAQENPEQAMQMAQQAGIDPAQIQQVVGQMQQ